MGMPSSDVDELAKFQWGAFTFTGVLGAVGAVYYLVKLRGRPAAVLAEHRSEELTAVGDELA